MKIICISHAHNGERATVKEESYTHAKINTSPTHPASGEYLSPPLGGDASGPISIMAGYAPFGANPSVAKHPHIWDPASFQED